MNSLTNLDAFKSVLEDYHLSSAGKEVLRGLRLTLLAAPTSSGRNTIINELIKTNEYYYVVSDTTRRPRVNNNVMETNGVEYWFRTEGEMLEDLKKGLFLEAAVIHDQQVSGISIRELEKAKSSSKIAITDIEIAGVDSVLAVKPDTSAVFVTPPSFADWHDRLEKRGSMTKQELNRRMKSAAEEFRHALEYDRLYSFVINDDLSDAVDHIHEIVFSGHRDPSYQKMAREVIERLLIDTEKFLQKQ